MTKLIVDSNIVFSAILNIHSHIGQILINGKTFYEFYAPKYTRTEIWEHQNKIKKISRLEDDQFIEVYELVMKNIIVLDHSIVPLENYKKAIDICKEIDEDDAVFVAFSEYLKCKLWTGDKKLINGLINKGFKGIMTTEELYKDFLIKSKKQRK
ncbi:PIN domain-containing protein [Sinomicrobium sp. M5D2P9]